MITLSNFLAIFYIVDQGIEFSFANIFSFLSLVFLLYAGLSLLNINFKNIFILFPVLIFIIDSIINILEGIEFTGLTQTNYRIITGIDSLLIIIPSLVIFSYLTYKAKDYSLAFFVVALLFYILGGSLASRGEMFMIIFFNLAVICFVVATILPILKNRLENLAELHN
jgi:hypothetical protein